MNNHEALAHRPEADSFQLRGSLLRVWEACLAYKWAVTLTTVLTIALVVVYMMLWPPVFQASVLIVADSEEDDTRDNFYQLWNVFRKDELSNEIELMTASPVLRRVVLDLELTYDDVYHPFSSHAVYLWTESWVGKKYRAIKYWFFPKPATPFGPTPEQIELARTIQAFDQGVVVSPIPNSTVGQLIVRAPSPRVAQIANALIDAYLDERRERFVGEAQHAYDSLAVEVENARIALEEIENERLRFHQDNDLLLEFEKDKLEISVATELEAIIRDGQARVAELERKQTEIQRQLVLEPEEITSTRVFAQNDLREEMRSRREELQTSLDALTGRYRPDSPEVEEMETLIAQIGQRIAAEDVKVEQSINRILNPVYESLRSQDMALTADLEGARTGLVIRLATLADLMDRVSQIPEKMTRAAVLSRAQVNREQRYQLLYDRLMMAEVSIATAVSAPPSMRVADYAVSPEKQMWPKTKLFLLVALLVGLGAGMCVAMLLDALRGRVTLTRLLLSPPAVPVYGVWEQAFSSGANVALVGNGQPTNGGRERSAQG